MAEHFIIVGAQRSGTTYLYRLLEQHPQICMARPVRPEPKFFLSNEPACLGYDHYLAACFGHRSSERLLGEKGTSYIEREDSIGRIRETLPQAKIIFVLRDPVLRALSNWRFSRDNGIETLSFAEAVEAEDERRRNWCNAEFSVCPFAYAERGFYAQYLDSWAAQFPREQMILLTTESLTSNPNVVQDLLKRLGAHGNLKLASPGLVNAANSDPDDDALPTLRALRRRYRHDTQRLSADWGVDVSPWSA